MRLLAALGLLVALASPATAQPAPASPYREQLASEIRGLSAQEIDDLREGRGMGLARAAELNGYPGPRHLLDLVEAGQMHLMAEQFQAVKQLFNQMSAQARGLGEKILGEEQALEAAFRQGSITEPELQRRVARITQLQAELRLVHLRTHLETKRLLTAHQVEQYNQLRGYGQGGGKGDQHPGRH